MAGTHPGPWCGVSSWAGVRADRRLGEVGLFKAARSPAKGRKQVLFLVEIPGVEEGVAAFSGASLHVSGGGGDPPELPGGELNRFRRQ